MIQITHKNLSVPLDEQSGSSGSAVLKIDAGAQNIIFSGSTIRPNSISILILLRL